MRSTVRLPPSSPGDTANPTRRIVAAWLILDGPLASNSRRKRTTKAKKHSSNGFSDRAICGIISADRYVMSRTVSAFRATEDGGELVLKKCARLQVAANAGGGRAPIAGFSHAPVPYPMAYTPNNSPSHHHHHHHHHVHHHCCCGGGGGCGPCRWGW